MIKCPQIKDRHIFVIDFLDMFSYPLISDKRYCNFKVRNKEEFDYNIVYIPMHYGTKSIDLLNTYTSGFTSTCNAMVIYFERKGELGDCNAFWDFVRFMQVFPIQKTFMIAGGLVKDVVTKIHTDSQTRVITLVLSDFQSLLRSNNYQMIDHYFPHNGESRLSCAPWFSRFLSTAFNCGKGRMVQLSGTCYMTAAFNSIFLGERLRSLFMRAVNQYAEKFPENIPEIKKPLDDVLSCPRLGTDSAKTMYIVNFLYNAVCNRQQLKYEDYFEQGSATYFSATQGEGNHGNPFSVIYQLLMLLNIDFNLYSVRSRLDDFIELGFFANPAYVDSEAIREDPYVGIQIDNLIINPTSQCILVSLRGGIRSINPRGTEYDKKLRDLGYTPEMCAIGMEFEELDNPDIGGMHVVSGFKCNEIYKIYDSEANEIFEYNWYDDLDDLKAFGEDIAHKKRFRLSMIEIIHIIYIKGDVESTTCNF